MSKKFQVTDSQGRIVTLEEKTSITLTIALVLMIIAVIGVFATAARALAVSGFTAVPFVIVGLIGIIYVFVINHLRKKGDMSVDRAVFPTTYGGYVEVAKKSSIWITIAFALTVIGLIAALGALGYGVYVYVSGGPGLGLIMSGSVMSIFMLIYFSILRFLRTKIDFQPENVLLRATSGQLIELYKRRSIWLTLGMVFAIIGAIIFLALGVLMFAGAASFYTQVGSMVQPTITTTNYGGSQPMLMTGLMSGSLASLPAILSGILMLITAAVLSFLRVRGHIREYEGQTARPDVMVSPPPPPPAQ